MGLKRKKQVCGQDVILLIILSVSFFSNKHSNKFKFFSKNVKNTVDVSCTKHCFVNTKIIYFRAHIIAICKEVWSQGSNIESQQNPK